MSWTLQDLAAVATIASGISSVLLLITAVIAVQQLRLQKTGADTERRRFLRETISLVHETLQDLSFREARSSFFSKDRSGYHLLSDEEKGWARSVLATYGLIGRMVKHDAVEESLVRDYWRSAFLRDWGRLRSFVDQERVASRNSDLFIYAEELASRWSEANA
jgi:hypothetical protein